MKKSDILFKVDPKGVEFATLAFHPSEKNHQGTSHCHRTLPKNVFHRWEGLPCKISYLSKLHPDCEAPFQHSKVAHCASSTIWYYKREVGVNVIGYFMVKISNLLNFQLGTLIIVLFSPNLSSPSWSPRLAEVAANPKKTSNLVPRNWILLVQFWSLRRFRRLLLMVTTRVSKPSRLLLSMVALSTFTSSNVLLCLHCVHT